MTKNIYELLEKISLSKIITHLTQIYEFLNCGILPHLVAREMGYASEDHFYFNLREMSGFLSAHAQGDFKDEAFKLMKAIRKKLGRKRKKLRYTKNKN